MELTEYFSNGDPFNLIGTLIAAILGGLVALYTIKAQPSSSLVRERHDLLFSPLFMTLEPILFSKIDTEVMEKALAIIAGNLNLADGSTLDVYRTCRSHPTQNSFMELCTYVNKNYDRSCRRLGLKRRNLEYRIAHRQYASKLSFILYVLALVLRFVIVAFVSIISILVLSALATAAYDELAAPQQVTALALIAFLLLNITRLISNSD
ncbi:hypothetical protein M2454_002898 [Aequitasia blattaphilus]|uniref:Uncharacterized protein n=1 Tax=Aequitasia blattaphilus TaxID=2949332 RepID=A0ABT1EF51_9FIRM|nr:hypothetical protein [Aequitasia blattaphilus]MCP1103562.1 hypothetical protein [Aequitasia blattaphilus]MCR8616202.1 hypothetical protein [Aequitasia blattaphilus]